MGETCLHMPARVFGFESSEGVPGQTHRSPSGQPEQRASLLSAALLRGSHQPPTSLPTYMDTSDAYSGDEDEDMEDDGEEEGEKEEKLLSAAGGSAPMRIPFKTDAFLKAQSEALKRFIYAHQIEEMRKQCAAYFARQARHGEVPAADTTVNSNAPISSALAGAAGKNMAAPQPGARQRKPGF